MRDKILEVTSDLVMVAGFVAFYYSAWAEWGLIGLSLTGSPVVFLFGFAMGKKRIRAR